MCTVLVGVSIKAKTLSLIAFYSIILQVLLQKKIRVCENPTLVEDYLLAKELTFQTAL